MIVALEHRERVGLADARVVGDLVVAHEGRVADRHALDDVGHQQRRDEVAHHHGDRRADQRIEAAAVHVRGAAAALAAGRAPLGGDVRQRQRDRAHEPVGIGEVGEQVPRLRAAAVAGSRSSWPCSAARRRRTCCRGWCPRRRAARRRSRAGARSRPRRRDGWRRACGPTPSHTSGTRACPSCCRAAARPGWRPSARRGRTPSRCSRCEPSASQRAIVGACPSRSASRSTPSPSPSISNRITPGTSVWLRRRRLRDPAPDDAQMARVPVDVEQRRHDHRDEREAERDRQIRPERRRLAVHHVERERDHAGAEHERAETERDDRQRQRDARDERPQDRVDQRHHDRTTAAARSDGELSLPGSSAVRSSKGQDLRRRASRRRGGRSPRPPPSRPVRLCSLCLSFCAGHLVASVSSHGRWRDHGRAGQARPGTVSFSSATRPS